MVAVKLEARMGGRERGKGERRLRVIYSSAHDGSNNSERCPLYLRGHNLTIASDCTTYMIGIDYLVVGRR